MNENKTKYFMLRLSDEVGTERPETDLRLTSDWPDNDTDLRLAWDWPDTDLWLTCDWPETGLKLAWHWPVTDLWLTWDWPETDLRQTCERPMRKRWRFSALDHLVPDRRTDRRTEWLPELLTEPKTKGCMMDEVYTICEDWGEGSGLTIEETDCNAGEPGEY